MNKKNYFNMISRSAALVLLLTNTTFAGQNEELCQRNFADVIKQQDTLSTFCGQVDKEVKLDLNNTEIVSQIRTSLSSIDPIFLKLDMKPIYTYTYADNGNYRGGNGFNNGNSHGSKSNSKDRNDNVDSVVFSNSKKAQNQDNLNNNSTNNNNNGFNDNQNGNQNNNQNNNNNNNQNSEVRIESRYLKRMFTDLTDSKPNGKQSNVKITNQIYYHSSHRFEAPFNMDMGGYSGLTYDAKTKSLYTVSDDKRVAAIVKLQVGTKNGAPAYGEKFYITPLESVPNPVEDNKNNFSNIPAPKYVEGDNEEIVLLPDGNFVISSEDSKNPLKLYTKEGKYITNLKLPDAFEEKWESRKVTYDCSGYEYTNVQVPVTTAPAPVVTTQTAPPVEEKKGMIDSFFGTSFFSDSKPAARPAQTQAASAPQVTYRQDSKWVKKDCERQESKRVSGLEFNKGIEGMTIIPNSDYLLFANEGSLDVDKATPGLVRIYMGRVSEMTAAAPEQFFKYRTDTQIEMGVVAMAALDNHRVLVMERGFDQNIREGVVRIFFVDLNNSKKGVLQKKLIVDLKDLKSQMPVGLRKVDNFEGLALGDLVGNKRQLHLVSDNNFSPDQRTIFLTLEVNNDDLN